MAHIPAGPPSQQVGVAEVMAERYGMPVLDAPRSRLIAALHSLINWIIEHPDVPAATHIQLSHYPVSGNTTITPEDLAVMAGVLHGKIDGSARSQWLEAQLCTLQEHGASINLVVFAGDVKRHHRPL